MTLTHTAATICSLCDKVKKNSNFSFRCRTVVEAQRKKNDESRCDLEMTQSNHLCIQMGKYLPFVAYILRRSCNRNRTERYFCSLTTFVVLCLFTIIIVVIAVIVTIIAHTLSALNWHNRNCNKKNDRKKQIRWCRSRFHRSWSFWDGFFSLCPFLSVYIG